MENKTDSDLEQTLSIYKHKNFWIKALKELWGGFISQIKYNKNRPELYCSTAERRWSHSSHWRLKPRNELRIINIARQRLVKRRIWTPILLGKKYWTHTRTHVHTKSFPWEKHRGINCLLNSTNVPKSLGTTIKTCSLQISVLKTL